MSVYNGEKYIAEQLESIINQDIGNIELYVRLDGSSDDSLKIIKMYLDKIPMCVFNESNIGPKKSFWKLLNIAPDADYYAFADQDDFWFSDKLSRAILCLENLEQEQPLLYCSAVQPTDEKLNPIVITKKKHLIYTDFPHSLIYSLSQGCTFVFNREAVRQARKYSMETNFVMWHDWLLHKIVAMMGTVHYDSTPSMYYRQHKNNAIGARSFGLENFLKRAKNILTSNECVRSKSAASLRSVYSDWLKTHPQEKYILDLIADYKTNKVFKKLLISETAFKTTTVNDVVRNLLILCEKL